MVTANPATDEVDEGAQKAEAHSSCDLMHLGPHAVPQLSVERCTLDCQLLVPLPTAGSSKHSRSLFEVSGELRSAGPPAYPQAL